MQDTYYPPNTDNPQIRLRQRGDRCILTKKYPLVGNDLSTMVEESINLTESEYKFLNQSLAGHKIIKNRYSRNFGDYLIEIDEYLEDLKPLIVLDIEWFTHRQIDTEIISQFDVIKEITDISVLAAGKIAGKSYADIKEYLLG